MNDSLSISCSELREIAETNLDEIEVIVEMMIEAEEELCQESAELRLASTREN